MQFAIEQSTSLCIARSKALNASFVGPKRWLIEFDQDMMANMTAALAYVCKRIPADKDSYDTRKRIADAMIASAHSGWRPLNLNDFQNVGLKVLAEITRPSRSKTFGLRHRMRRR